MPKYKSVADCLKQGDGRYNADRSLYLVVRGGSALWEKQYRQGGKLRTKCYGSVVGAAPVSLTQARALDAADWLERRSQRQFGSNAKYDNGTIRQRQRRGVQAVLGRPRRIFPGEASGREARDGRQSNMKRSRACWRSTPARSTISAR